MSLRRRQHPTAPAGLWLGIACVWAAITLLQLATFLRSGALLTLFVTVISAMCAVLSIVAWRRSRRH